MKKFLRYYKETICIVLAFFGIALLLAGMLGIFTFVFNTIGGVIGGVAGYVISIIVIILIVCAIAALVAMPFDD